MGMGMKAIGNMIIIMVTEKKFGKMDRRSLGNTTKERSRVLVLIIGLMVLYTQASGAIIQLLVLGPIHGLMEESIREAGRIMKWMDTGFTITQTEKFT